MTKMAIVFEPEDYLDPSEVLDEAKEWLYYAGFQTTLLDNVYVIADYREPIPTEPQGLGAVVRVHKDGWSTSLHFVQTGDRKWASRNSPNSVGYYTWGEVVNNATTVKVISQGIDL